MTITREALRSLYDYRAAGERARGVVKSSFSTMPRAIRFVSRYAAWNGVFGSGVAALAAKIGRSRALFLEEGFPKPLADRSVLVASYMFDAARDEFDDRDTKYRDTHRCLAQATLAGLVEYASTKGGLTALRDAKTLEAALIEPAWLERLRANVATGYGVGTPDERGPIFRAIGYHLGSELLADREFSVIDSELRAGHPALVAHLSESTITIAGQPHPCYQWFRIHSGHGGGAEADHFQWALEGVATAFRFAPRAEHEALERAIGDGYLDFARDHEEFFAKVDEGDLAF